MFIFTPRVDILRMNRILLVTDEFVLTLLFQYIKK